MEHVASPGVYDVTARGDKMEQEAEVEPTISNRHWMEIGMHSMSPMFKKNRSRA